MTQELKKTYGTDRMSFTNFEKWRVDNIKEWNFVTDRAKRKREEVKRDIKRLREKIKELQQDIKKPLPQKPHIDRTTYNYAKTDAKIKAEAEGWTWIEPEEGANKEEAGEVLI